MDHLNKNYPILSQKNILGSSQVGINAPIVVFLMDRIIISDDKVTREESDTFNELADLWELYIAANPKFITHCFKNDIEIEDIVYSTLEPEVCKLLYH